MKVFLLKDVEKIGMAGEIVKVSEGYADNYLVPRKFAVVITPQNESQYMHRIKSIENRKEVVATKTSMLAEKIRSLKLSIKRKAHDSGQLYGAVGALEIVELLSAQGISIAKNQVIFDKTIKTTGTAEVTIKLTSQLQPKMQIKIVAE